MNGGYGPRYLLAIMYLLYEAKHSCSCRNQGSWASYRKSGEHEMLVSLVAGKLLKHKVRSCSTFMDVFGYSHIIHHRAHKG